MSQDPESKLSTTGIDFTPTIHDDTYEYIKPEQFDLRGRAVLVTGASKGVGRATAIAFAKAGASKIAIAARSGMKGLDSEIQKTTKDAGKEAPEVLELELDVVNEQSVASAAKQVEQVFGLLDIVVNNAGFLEKFVPIHESAVEDWWRTWEVNIKGPYLVSRAVLPLMLKTENGLRTILNVSSIGAHIARPGASGYQSTKLALLRFGEFLNAEYAEQGLISFGVHPGAIPTELAKGMPESMHSKLGDTPELAADTFVWLSAERRDWLRGRYVSSTWDMKELLDKRASIEKGDLLKVRMDLGVEY